MKKILAKLCTVAVVTSIGTMVPCYSRSFSDLGTKRIKNINVYEKIDPKTRSELVRSLSILLDNPDIILPKQDTNSNFTAKEASKLINEIMELPSFKDIKCFTTLYTALSCILQYHIYLTSLNFEEPDLKADALLSVFSFNLRRDTMKIVESYINSLNDQKGGTK